MIPVPWPCRSAIVTAKMVEPVTVLTASALRDLMVPVVNGLNLAVRSTAPSHKFVSVVNAFVRKEPIVNRLARCSLAKMVASVRSRMEIIFANVHQDLMVGFTVNLKR